MIDMKSARIRGYLLASTALLALPGVAQAEGRIDPSQAELGAHSNAGRVDGGQAELNAHADRADITNEYLAPQNQNLVNVGPEPDILIANPNTPTTARDPVNITGIGQMVVNNGGGSVGLCTATLINPRVVIFAAHCVNSRAASAYGNTTGGTPIGFGFETNTRANAAGQPDELLNWVTGGSTGPGMGKTNVAQAFYNSNWVSYNTLSLEAAARGFLYGDVAMASLDTPAANIPTWALLFSQLTGPTTSTAAGTGYNVGLVGYGNNGTGTSGPPVGQNNSIDFRRRAADNVLGALTDLQTFEGFLFGGAPNGLTQNLYFIDFDDPRRGMSGVSPFDFNAFRDNARGAGTNNPTEGTTSQGDSGGPLILQNTFARQVVIGVLSGGYGRFFAGQPADGYGTVSFYQPLYLYWDWIAANNPYHYVGSVAGNGAWTDPTHWVTTLDPAYMVQSGTTLVNGLPTLTGQQKDGTSGDFGEICFESGGTSDCLNTRTGQEVVVNRPIGTGDEQPAAATVEETAADIAATGVARGDLIPGAQPEAHAAATTPPAATLANGLPGATNFVPNNADPVRTGTTLSTPRYFDVTLAATGTTTLSGANVTIDRLTIGTSGAQLVIDAGASLTALLGVNHLAGFNTVNGTLNSGGDYSLMGGGLMGTGRINAPFLTSVLGQIAPGTTSTIGTLTIGGNLVLSSGSTYFVNLGTGSSSDRLAVVANGTATGAANVGGNLVFSAVAGSTPRDIGTYTILTADGGRTGTFNTPAAFSAVLTPQLTYTANSVQVRLVAGSYRNAVSAGSPVQVAYANLLDQNRASGRSSVLGLIYDYYDLQNAGTIQAAFDSWAPRTETQIRALGATAVENAQRFFRGRLDQLDVNGEYDGSVAVMGSPLSIVASAAAGGGTAADVMAAAQGDPAIAPGRLPDGIRGYVSAGYLDGNSRPMATAVPAVGRDDFDGYFIGLGLETKLGENGAFGAGFNYTKLDGKDGGALLQRTSGKLWQINLYAKGEFGNGLVVDGQLGGGLFLARTHRTTFVGPTAWELRSADKALAISGEAGIAKYFGSEALRVGPRIAFRSSRIGFSDVTELGGPTALQLDRKARSTAQGMAGLSLTSNGTTFRPFASAYLVHDFLDSPTSFGANFVGGAGPNAIFATAGTDKNWGEASLGFSLGTGRYKLSLSADTTVFRKDIENQSYRATVSFKF
jgi:hypothetical protein